ncbi:hypothetical protein PHMEG_00012595 [Phytophthora megakarya]|uniref:Uncharacterized protein n=1 Tax=Phytophthora megakarya TaxID=4795 RepID=A0A225W9C0_9STRA|nr:hypothetical protein PHMEG_00012595 [Phytophthora megakarya]
MSFPGVISGVATLADTGIVLAPIIGDSPPIHGDPEVHIVGVPAPKFAMRNGAKVYPGHGGVEILLCFESLDAAGFQDLNALMGADDADRLLTLRQSVAQVSLAAEVGSVAGQRELASLLSQFPLDRLAERMINSLSLIRRLLAKVRHLRAVSEAEDCGTLSSQTLVARDNYDTMRLEWTVMCRQWSQRVPTLKPEHAEGKKFLRQGLRDAEISYQGRVSDLTDQITRLHIQRRDSEAAHREAERRASERVLDVNALVDFLVGNQPNINVMFNWMHLAALLHHFVEDTSIPES